MPYPTWALLSLLPLISSPTQEKPSQEKTVRANVVLLLDDKSASFVTPFATAADPKSGEIYIADQEGNAVFVFAENGREKAKLAVPAPMGVTLDRSGQIYVLNTKGEIAIYDFQGRKIGDLVPTGLPQDAAKPQPLQIMMGDKDDLFIADGANQAVLMLDSKGKFQRAFGTIGTKAKGPRFKGLKSFCVGRNKVYVIDGNTSQVSVFSRTSGDLLFSFGESGGSHLQLAVPVSITVD
ncbi:MAG: hypothetical protein HYY16_12450, partial [Planctomycetes bacterium]|nr:hypothetical protein [Planctomycetota bacterium]